MIAQSPIPGQTRGVIEDAVVHREPEVTGEALHRLSVPSGRVLGKQRHKGRPEASAMRCEVADESVVVMKSRPVKAGNSLEGKTGTTRRLVGGGRYEPKAVVECEGRKFIRRFRRSCLRTSSRTQAARRGGTRYRR